MLHRSRLRPAVLAMATLLVLLIAPRPVCAADAGPLAPAIAHVEARRYEEARKLLEPYARAHPRDAEAAFQLGKSFFGLGDYASAAEWLGKAAELTPRRSDVQLWLARSLGRQARDASLLRQPGLAKRAKAAWDRAVELDPDNLDARNDLIQFYLQAPGIMGGSVEKARNEANEIARRDPMRGALAHATIASDQDDPAGAERILQEAIAKQPKEPRLRFALSARYAEQKRWDAALAAVDAVLAEDPDNLDAHYQVGRIAALSGRYLDRGKASLERYLGHTPGPDSAPLANAHFRLGTIHEHRKDVPAARGEYQAALRLNPKLEDAKKALAKLK